MPAKPGPRPDLPQIGGGEGGGEGGGGDGGGAPSIAVFILFSNLLFDLVESKGITL